MPLALLQELRGRLSDYISWSRSALTPSTSMTTKIYKSRCASCAKGSSGVRGSGRPCGSSSTRFALCNSPSLAASLPQAGSSNSGQARFGTSGLGENTCYFLLQGSVHVSQSC